MLTSPRRVLVIGTVFAIVSAAGTALYFASVYLLPLFFVALIVLHRRARPGRAATFGVSLATASVLMPVVALGGFFVFSWIDGRQHPMTMTTGWPVFWVIFAPAVTALIACLIYAAMRSRRQSSIHGDRIAV